jgi:hypothetical protein
MAEVAAAWDTIAQQNLKGCWMNIPAERPKKVPLIEVAGFTIAAIVFAAFLIAIFVLTLALLLLLSQKGASALGYKFVISDEVAKAVIAVGGAVAVGGLALYGVHRQNMSAEKRHRVDSSLALRKEIFLQVAEAASVQYQSLLSFVTPGVTDADRKTMIDKVGGAFFRLQMVASHETIAAMIDANEEWTRALLNIQFLGPVPLDRGGSLVRLIDIQQLATPFMRKLWQFNMMARKEIECQFGDDPAYFLMMEEKFSHVRLLFEELRGRIVT